MFGFRLSRAGSGASTNRYWTLGPSRLSSLATPDQSEELPFVDGLDVVLLCIAQLGLTGVFADHEPVRVAGNAGGGACAASTTSGRSAKAS